MRILVINPNTTQAMTDEIHHVAKAAASPGTEIETVQPKGGPRSIEGNAYRACSSERRAHQRDEQAAERADAWWNGYNQDE